MCFTFLDSLKAMNFCSKQLYIVFTIIFLHKWVNISLVFKTSLSTFLFRRRKDIIHYIFLPPLPQDGIISLNIIYGPFLEGKPNIDYQKARIWNESQQQFQANSPKLELELDFYSEAYKSNPEAVKIFMNGNELKTTSELKYVETFLQSKSLVQTNEMEKIFRKIWHL